MSRPTLLSLRRLLPILLTQDSEISVRETIESRIMPISYFLKQFNPISIGILLLLLAGALTLGANELFSQACWSLTQEYGSNCLVWLAVPHQFSSDSVQLLDKTFALQEFFPFYCSPIVVLVGAIVWYEVKKYPKVMLAALIPATLGWAMVLKVVQIAAYCWTIDAIQLEGLKGLYGYALGGGYLLATWAAAFSTHRFLAFLLYPIASSHSPATFGNPFIRIWNRLFLAYASAETGNHQETKGAN